MVPKCHFPLKEPGFLGEMAGSRASSGHLQDDSGTLVPLRKKVDEDIAKTHRKHLKKASGANMWKLNIKITTHRINKYL